MAVGTTNLHDRRTDVFAGYSESLSHRGWVLTNKKPSDDNAQSTLGREEPSKNLKYGYKLNKLMLKVNVN